MTDENLIREMQVLETELTNRFGARDEDTETEEVDYSDDEKEGTETESE